MLFPTCYRNEVIDYIEVDGIEGLVAIEVMRRHLPEGPTLDWYMAVPVDDPHRMEMRVDMRTGFNSDEEAIEFIKTFTSKKSFIVTKE